MRVTPKTCACFTNVPMGMDFDLKLSLVFLDGNINDLTLKDQQAFMAAQWNNIPKAFSAVKDNMNVLADMVTQNSNAIESSSDILEDKVRWIVMRVGKDSGIAEAPIVLAWDGIVHVSTLVHALQQDHQDVHIGKFECLKFNSCNFTHATPCKQSST